MKCLLFSGGFDSACAWYALGRPPALYCGGPFGPARHANKGEMRAVERMCEVDSEFASKLVVVEHDFRPFMREGVYDFPRDLVTCALAWGAGFDHAMMAWVKDDGVTPEWANRQRDNFARHVGMPGFSVSFPVAHLSKCELLQRALRSGASVDFLAASHSCLVSSEPCGECKSCWQRNEMLAEVAA